MEREIPRVFLLPSELYISRKPTLISTILGSCVAVILYNKAHHFGGMNHFMLAHPKMGEPPTFKHGIWSVEKLIELMRAEDKHADHLDARVFGGGNVAGHLSFGIGKGIGPENIRVALEILEKHKIPIVAKNVGGDYGRKIHFENWTGEATFSKIEKSALTRAAEEKKKSLRERKIKVLIVDDSPTIRSILSAAVSDDPAIEVIGAAGDPYEARELLLEHDPDVICLDIIMPRMDGITFLKKLFLYMPKPVIIISTVVQEGSKLREQAEKIGAFSVIDKAQLNLYKGIHTVRNILTSKIKAASTVIVRPKTKEELEAI